MICVHVHVTVEMGTIENNEDSVVQHAMIKPVYIKNSEIQLDISNKINDFEMYESLQQYTLCSSFYTWYWSFRIHKRCRPRLNIDKTERLSTGTYINEYANKSVIYEIRITKTCTNHWAW